MQKIYQQITNDLFALHRYQIDSFRSFGNALAGESNHCSIRSSYENFCEACNKSYDETELWFTDNGDADNPHWRVECREGHILDED